jgi:hypothetical protein
MDKFNLSADTGKIKNSLYFGQLSCNKKIIENMPFCKAKNAQMQDNERS